MNLINRSAQTRPPRRYPAILACLPIVAGLAQFTTPTAGMGSERSAEIAGRIQKVLTENIIPFWYPEVVDGDHGGYRLHHDRQGRRLEDAPKVTVTQARVLWFFSRLLESPYGRPEYREAARHGFRFLADHVWDPEYGGFYWSVSADGVGPIQDGKHLYAQAFALYGLACYARVTGDGEAVRLAQRLLSLIEEKAHDPRYGGYRENLSRDWSAVTGSEPSPLGPSPDVKTMNTHLHLMEALTEYRRLHDTPLVRERLAELVLIESNAVIRKPYCQGTDVYRPDWTPVLEGSAAMTSYGHDLENVWLLMEALEGLDVPQAPLVDFYRAVWEAALRWGYDRALGGFWYRGELGKPASVLTKEWWVQAEALVSALRMYRATGEQRYFEVFEKLWEWIETRQVDWTYGEWFANIEPDGSVRGDKAGPWKGPYHNARAMLECLELLKESQP